MSADSAILEALARIEHKVDLALDLCVGLMNRTAGPAVHDLPGMTDPKLRCPVCGQQPKYILDIMAAVVNRKCGCGTGMVPVDLNALAPPIIPRRPHADAGADQEPGDSSRSGARQPTHQGRPPGR